jgi:RNA ligase-like protein
VKFNVRTVDLAKLNSLTKYPSILTYHTLDPKNGGLLEEATAFAGTVIGTEKVDGTNSRVISLPDGCYLLGSREELLYGKGDLIGNPSLGIVEALKETADRLCDGGRAEIMVYYFEVFGGKVTANSKQYTGEQRVSFRLFDVVALREYDALLSQPAAQIAQWRDNGGQSFADEATLERVAAQYELTLTPRLFAVDGADLPRGIPETLAFLRTRLPESKCRLDDAGGGKPEGIVLRSSDRSTIAKARFEDYERTLKRKRS